MTQLNWPAGYNRAQHICRPQIAGHALLQAQHFLGICFCCDFTHLLLKTGLADAQMGVEGGSQGMEHLFYHQCA